MKTIKQIADELGVSKQRVYRCVKANRINESHRKHDTLLFNEAVETLIKSHFAPTLDRINEAHQAQKTVSKEADNAPYETVNFALVEMLRAELEIKNRQIDELTAANRELATAVTAAQALHGGTMKQTLIEEKTEPRGKGFLGRFFGKRAE